MKSSRGFTLIELLVVIAIIGILSSVVLASLNTARQKANDTRRISDLSSMRTALELYYSDNGKYPITGTAWRSQCGSWGGYAPIDVIPGLAPTYIPTIPTDPQMNAGANQNCYLYRSDTGAGYKILDYNLQNSNVRQFPQFMDPGRNYGVRPSNSCGAEATYTFAIYAGTDPQGGNYQCY